MSQFFTVENLSEGLYKEKGSKFLAFSSPVSSENDVKHQLEVLRKKYHDARHHCYAYVLGMDQQSFRANDDGEPSHSAGDPILGQIRSFELTNVLVVVVRYFGGTKLGVGGLIHAYKTATEEALKKASRKEIFEEVNLLFQFPYDLLSSVERLITELDISVIDRDFQEDCRINASMKLQFLDQLKNKTSDLYNLHLSITE
ncbi:MAG: YigZ family protein [Cyclobacteriaceae bacterium]